MFVNITYYTSNVNIGQILDKYLLKKEPKNLDLTTKMLESNILYVKNSLIRLIK